MKAFFLICLCLLVWATSSVAQIKSDAITTQWLGWYHVESIVLITPKWESILEPEDRRFQFIHNEHQYFIRLQLNYKLNKLVSVGGGFAYFGQEADSLNQYDDPLGTELRPHQQVLLEKENNRHSFSFRFRLEERFLRDVQAAEIENKYDFNFRIRFRPEWTYTLVKQKNREEPLLDFTMYDELMLSAGANVNLFNQNRSYGGFSLHPSKSATVEAGFLHAFQLRDSGDAYWNRHIIRLAFIYQWQLHP